MNVGPLQFEDFLHAMGETALAQWLRDVPLAQLEKPAPIPAIHDKYIALLRQYWVIGGLPEVVASFAANGSFSDVNRLQQNIVATYRDDFNKYSHGTRKTRVQLLFDRLPTLVGRKFKYAGVSREHRAAELALALQQLCMSRIAYKVQHTAAKNPMLHCWMREARTASAEVDYVISQGQQILPVEIKAGKSGTLKSLHIFLEEKHRRFGLRFNAAPPNVLRDAPIPGDPGQRYDLLSLPLYMVGQTRRLLDQFIV